MGRHTHLSEQPVGDVHYADHPDLREIPRSRAAARNCIVLCSVMALSLALLFSVAGAYDTGELGLDHRLILWTTIKVLVVAQAILFRALILRAMSDGWISQALAAIGSMLATNVVAGFEIHGMKVIGLLPKDPDPMLEFIVFLSPAVLPLAGVTVLIWILFDQRRDNAERLGNERQVEAHISIDKNLGASATSDWPKSGVMAVRAYDHYLEFRLEEGCCLVRGRMKDAVALLADTSGLQVHRSWWVSPEAVVHIKSRGRDKVIVLSDGEQVPIARSRLSVLRENGWI